MPPAALTTLTRRAFAVVALVVALTFGSAAAVHAQETPSTTTAGVLIPGTTAPPATVAPSSTTTTEAPAADDGLLDLDANEKVWVIVAGLVAVAVLMLVLTILYWRHTKPERFPQDKRITRAERKKYKKRRKATSKDPFLEDLAEPATPAAASTEAPKAEGPMDLDGLLGTPDPSRSVFGSAGEDPEPDR